MSRPPIKYLLYRSDAKVAMLAEQLSPRRFRHELAASVGVPGIGSLQTTVKERFARPSTAAGMLRVIKKLDKDGLIGTVAEPKPYFRGTMEMRWGAFGGHWSAGDLVFFSGISNRTVVGLGGSIHHVTQRNPLAIPGGHAVMGLNSYTPYIMDVLSREFPVEMRAAGFHGSDSVDEAVDHCLVSVLSAHFDAKGPKENVEFVAKRLVRERMDHKYDYLGHEGLRNGRGMFDDIDCILLGTPLYVALAE
jgi:hypothetical protein